MIVLLFAEGTLNLFGGECAAEASFDVGEIEVSGTALPECLRAEVTASDSLLRPTAGAQGQSSDLGA
jgi:hypothetical protein